MRRRIKILLKALAALALAACAAYIYARYIEPARISFRREEIECPGLTQPVKIAAMADLHVGVGGMDCARLRKIVAAAAEQKPDMVVFLGDLFENYRRYSHGREHEIAAALKLSEHEGCGGIAVMGNHDQNGGAESAFEEVFTVAGWKVLVNERLEYMGLNVIGSDSVTFGSPDINGLIAGDKPNLLLIHEPDYGEKLRGVEVQLSGHTHAGQVRIPFFGATVLPVWGKKYVSGLYKKTEGGSIFVSRGLGMSRLPLRFLSPPEVSVITLVPEEQVQH